MIRIIFLLFWTSFTPFIFAQNITVGTLFNQPASENGYTLFSPLGNLNTYLVNNCGEVVNRWATNYVPGLSAYLHTDGTLYRSGRINNASIPLSGQGGRIERFGWNGNLLWGYTYSGANYAPHHDFCILPNGNVVLIVAEKKMPNDVYAVGRDSTLFDSTYTFLLTDYLVELEPIGLDSARVVWEWHAWDHLIQYRDSTKPNYGNPVQNPGLIDINFVGHPDLSDWLHCNSVDYLPEYDQLLISVRNLNEVWIIDHSTTSAEAANHLGGLRGKGGDLLYRWGNPEAYGGGTQADRVFERQHNARWTQNKDIIVYNNAPSRGYASVDWFRPSVDTLGFYTPNVPNAAYLPSQLERRYHIDTSISSVRLSGAQELPNGNTLVSNGTLGYIIEITSTDSIVWAYRSPVGLGGIVTQGTVPASYTNEIFNSVRYFSDFIGFAGLTLTGGVPIELDYDISHCQIYNVTESIDVGEPVVVFPNPTNDVLYIKSSVPISSVAFYNEIGQLCYASQEGNTELLINHLPSGLYILLINSIHIYKILIL